MGPSCQDVFWASQHLNLDPLTPSLIINDVQAERIAAPVIIPTKQCVQSIGDYLFNEKKLNMIFLIRRVSSLILMR